MGVTAKAPGTCGELVQGTINGQNFLITCPINVYSEVAVSFGQRQTGSIGDKCRLASDGALTPPEAFVKFASSENLSTLDLTGRGLTGCVKEKTRAAVIKTLAYLQEPAAELIIATQSELPVGKGMASSSADIAAACQATAQCFGRVLTADEIADIALSIEPTDGIFYPGIVMFDHVSGSIRRSLGAPPTLYIAVFDIGGEVNTQHFNQRKDLASLNAAKEARVQQAAELVTEGLRCGDSQMIGQGATLSAIANQTMLYKPCLEKVIEIAERFGAVGVNTAHSGTVVGILFPASELRQMPSCITTVSAACSGISYWRTVQMISGGLNIAEG